MFYFNARGRAESSRFILSQAGVKFEDVRMEYAGEDWAKLKPNTPTGMLPVLEVDGKQIAGSGPIARFLAERFDLAGSNDFENAEIASLVDVMDDFFGKLVAFLFERSEERKPMLKKQLEDEHFAKYWGVIEKAIEKNGSEKSWVYGQKPTYADFTMYTLVDYTFKVFPNILESYPGIAKMRASVEALPNIAKWIEERPKTDF